jgi:hypothetical protein
MSRLVERVARKLAQPGGAAPRVEPSEPDTSLITRRQASRRAAAGALTITAATALGPWAGNAAAAGYCFSDCVNNAENNLDQKLDSFRSNMLHRASTFAFWIGVTGGYPAYLSLVYADYYEDRAGCYLSNCGDPAQYPPPNPGGGGGGGGGGGTQGCGSGCVDCGAPPAGTYCACAGAVCCARQGVLVRPVLRRLLRYLATNRPDTGKYFRGATREAVPSGAARSSPG